MKAIVMAPTPIIAENPNLLYVVLASERYSSRSKPSRQPSFTPHGSLCLVDSAEIQKYRLNEPSESRGSYDDFQLLIGE